MPSGYAERVAVPAQWVLPLAPGIAPETAAAALIQSMTAHYLSQAAYPVQPGGTVPVHAGAGGVGDPDGHTTRRPGDLHGLNCAEGKARTGQRRRETDFTAEVARLTAEAGVAAIYDGVEGTTFDRNPASLAPRGVLAIYGQARGPIPPFDPARLVQAGSVYLTRTR